MNDVVDIIDLIKPTLVLCINHYMSLRDQPYKVGDLAFMDDGSIIVEPVKDDSLYYTKNTELDRLVKKVMEDDRTHEELIAAFESTLPLRR